VGTPPSAPERPPVREALLVWAAVIFGLAAVQLLGLGVPLLRGLIGALAVAAFLYAPLPLLERRSEIALSGENP